MKKMAIAVGMESASKDGKINYPSLEYDIKDIDIVIADVQRLQKEYSLGDAIIVKTKNGYHVHFFWDWNLSWEKVTEIVNNSRASEEFKKLSEHYGWRVIRVSGKYKEPDLKIVCRVKGKHNSDETGNMLFGIFRKLMNLKLPNEALYE